MDLFSELQRKIEELNISVNNLKYTGKEYAEAYTKYRIKLATKLVELKDNGMAVTLAYDVARGQNDIAREKYNEIIKQSIYQANQEAINSLKLQIRILENQLQREWGKNE